MIFKGISVQRLLRKRAGRAELVRICCFLQADGFGKPSAANQENMADFYNCYCAPLPNPIMQFKSADTREARFQWFLAPAINLLLPELEIAGRR